MLAPYRSVLRSPGAKAFSFAGLLSRLPISSISLGIVLLVAARTGSYGYAGAVSAAYMLATAASSPVMGRLIDRFGQHRVLGPGFTGFATGIVCLVTAVELGWPTPVPHLFAVVAGALYPPVGACVRARWTHVLTSGPALHTAFSLEAVVDEVIFMTGPVVVTLLATQVQELAGLLVVLVVSTVGGWWLAALRATEPPLTAQSIPPGVLHASVSLGWGWLARMVVVAACLGSLFGSTEVATVAFSEEQGHAAVTGALLAIWAGGSLIAGVVTGSINWTATPLKRYRIGALGMALAMAPLPFVTSLPVLAAALFLAGFAISPTMVASMSLVEASVPPARLTEGITWISTGIGLGVAPGAAVAGRLIDAFGASTAYFVPVVSGVVAVTVAWATGPHRAHAEPMLEEAYDAGCE